VVVVADSVSPVAGGTVAAGVAVDVSLGAVTGGAVSVVAGAVSVASFLHAANKGMQANAISNVLISISLY